MKKTIKEDLKRTIIKEDLIGDNNLIQYEYDKEKDRVLLGVRFIDGLSMKEHILTILTVHEYASELNERVRFNEDNTAVAIFKKRDKEYVLHDCYDLETHSFAPTDFMDVEYNLKFPNNQVNDRFQLIKKNN